MSETVKLTQLPKPNFRITDLDLEITDKAMKVLFEATKEDNKDLIRIGVKGGGCSGFMYNLQTIDGSQIDPEEDITIDTQGRGFVIVIDVFSKDYLRGTVLDYISSLNETGFKFINPNAKKTCGCGSSFSA